jgi:integrase
LLALRWEHCQNGYLTFWETKNGKARRIPISPAIEAVLAEEPRIHPSVFANSRTGKPLTANGVAHTFERAVARAGITTGDVTLHTLRHTALSRMIANDYDDYTVMAISGHSSTRMLERYTHPTEKRKIGALSLDWLATKQPQCDDAADDDASTASEIAELLEECGGRHEARTRDLRVANAALSQLS